MFAKFRVDIDSPCVTYYYIDFQILVERQRTKQQSYSLVNSL